MPVIAVVRPVSASFAQALSEHPPESPIDVEKARGEHAAYVTALLRAGAEVVSLPPADDLPDACFVEDTAVVAGGLALITRPGAPSRRAEPRGVREVLSRYLPLEELSAPATLDGGDCLLLGKRLYVGLSARTNRDGVAQARAALAPRGLSVHEVPVRGALHLKSLCSPLGDGGLLVVEGAFPSGTFGDAQELVIPAAEAPAANVVVVGRHALIPAGFPEAARLVARRGFTPLEVDNRELRKADSALTCLSVLFALPGS
jgi:dimethylargininase